MNDKDILLLSATYPINTGPIAPPTGDIIKKEEARLVLFPNPFKDMAKIVGNMMASNTYTKNKATNEIFPKLQTIRKVAATVPKAQYSKTLSARIRCIIQLPAKPTNENHPCRITGIHPSIVHHIIDKETIDRNLCYFITE